ncbi:hypothetical protein ACWOB6_02600 [Falseniella ignava]
MAATTLPPRPEFPFKREWYAAEILDYFYIYQQLFSTHLINLMQNHHCISQDNF